MRCLSFIALFCVCLLSSLSLWAQQPAFPGAEGAGMYTAGGRGTPSVPTTVFEVTNLNDDNNPGSLRYALQASATTYPYKTIVFRVSGTIHLNSRLNVRANTTIAGQTAPGDGICIADYPVAISGDNVIIRYVRFRMGDKNQKKTDAAGNPVDGSGGDDALGALGANNVIIDHCSVSWSSDEALTIYRGDNLTIQWTFIAEPLNYSYHFETGDADYERHGYGGIWGAKQGSFHHNLFAHCYSRNPRFAGISTYTPATVGVENADFRNNVIYNWAINTVYGGEGGNYNVVNNYYKWGPNTNAGVKYRICNPGYSATVPYGKWYVDGNYVDGSPANTANNWAGVVMQNAADDPALVKAVTPFSLGFPQTTQTATDAYEAVLSGAGAILPKRDTLDQRIVNNVRTRTGGIIDVQGGYPHGTPYNQTVNAWPTLNSATPPADTDHDGMPDAWESANGLNPNDAADRNGYAANGYTNLENYLNSITGDNPSITVAGTLTSFSQTVGTPSATQTYSVSGTDLQDNITVTPPAGYQLSTDGGATWSASPLTLPRAGTTVASTNISVRLNGSTPGNYTGAITHSSTSAVISLPVSGTASAAPPTGTNVVVAKDGSGTYTTIQAAIDAAPSGSTTPYIIYIKNGTYKEKVNIPSGKPFLHLVGESAGGTVISWDDYSGKVVNGVTIGTSTSATVTISANDCFLMNLTVENTTGNTADGPQALALNVSGDRCAFKNCRFNGGQDTLLANGDGKRQYFRNCYVDGNTDFIFGSSTAVFDSCVIYPRDRYDGSGGGYVTAANTPAGQAYGYVFRNCILTKNRGITTYTLGRPWQNDAGTPDASKKNNKTVFLNASMSTSILPAGWSVWDAGTNTALITYAEYKSKKYNGTPVDVSGRVSWSKQLSDAEAAPYFVNSNLFGSWDPCTVSASLCTAAAAELAVSNMRAQRQTSSTLLSWNLSWPVPGVTYELYRSTNNTTFAKIYETSSATDTVVAFSYTDALPPGGTTYYYYVRAIKAGYLSNNSFTVSVNSDTPLDGEFRSAGSGTWNNNVYATATVSGGSVTAVTIVSSPTGYTTAPTVTFSAPSSGTTATGTAVLSGGVVTGVTITNPGSGYTSAPTLTFSTSGATAASVWEKYVASSSSWVLQTLGTKPGSSTIVTIRNGHTVMLDGLNTINSLVIENGGTLNGPGTASTNTNLQTLRVGNGTQPVTAFVRNNGTLGSATGTNDGLIIEANATCGSLTFTGSGTTSVARFRPLPGNPNNLNVTIDQDMAFNYNSVAFTGYYNNASNTNTENVTITINADKTLKLGALSQFHAGNTTANPEGNITYNVNGTLDLSATGSSFLVPSSVNSASAVAMNVNNGGLLKLGTSFSFTNATASAVYGTSRININDGGVVDASLTAALTSTNAVASGFFVLNGSGSLKRSVSSTAVAFPVGNATAMLPVTISNSGTADAFSVGVKTFDVTPPTANRVNKQWNITEDLSGGSNATLKLSWLASEQTAGFNPVSAVFIYHYNGSTWDATPATVTGSGTAADPYAATASGFTSFSPFAVGNAFAPLPVTFISSKAYAKSDGIAVEWTTATETGIKNFAVEKSTDGRTFVQAGIVAAANRAASYAWLDAAPAAGDNFYRIKAVEEAGGRYTGVMKVTLGKKTATFVMAPNPVKGSLLNVQLSGLEKGKYALRIYNAAGQQISQQTFTMEGAALTQTFALPKLAAGVYSVQLANEKTSLMQKIVID